MMTEINKDNIGALLLGTTFLGTGGGGNPRDARTTYQKLIKNKKKVLLVDLGSFHAQDLFVTAFPVGSLTTAANDHAPVKIAFDFLSRHLKQKIRGILPVEIGPKSVATAVDLASLLGVPVIDADMVGGRSTPEVFLETITLFGLARTPAAIANKEGDISLLLQSSCPQNEEKFFRDFAQMSGGLAYVVGYPLRKRQLEKAIELGTVSQGIELGKLLEQNNLDEMLRRIHGKVLFEGTIKSVKDENSQGFTKRGVQLTRGGQKAKVFVKNENLILWINGKVALTCPDLIVFLDDENKPMYNADLKQGATIKIVGVPARPLWRTPEGIKLFNPRLFGFSMEPKLLEDTPRQNQRDVVNHQECRHYRSAKCRSMSSGENRQEQ